MNVIGSLRIIFQQKHFFKKGHQYRAVPRALDLKSSLLEIESRLNQNNFHLCQK